MRPQDASLTSPLPHGEDTKTVVVFSHDIGVTRSNKSFSGYAALTLPTLLLSSASSSTRLLFDNLVLAFPASTARREGEKSRVGDWRETGEGKDDATEAAAARHLIDKAKVRRSAAAAAALLSRDILGEQICTQPSNRQLGFWDNGTSYHPRLSKAIHTNRLQTGQGNSLSFSLPRKGDTISCTIQRISTNDEV